MEEKEGNDLGREVETTPAVPKTAAVVASPKETKKRKSSAHDSGSESENEKEDKTSDSEGHHPFVKELRRMDFRKSAESKTQHDLEKAELNQLNSSTNILDTRTGKELKSHLSTLKITNHGKEMGMAEFFRQRLSIIQKNLRQNPGLEIIKGKILPTR